MPGSDDCESGSISGLSKRLESQQNGIVKGAEMGRFKMKDTLVVGPLFHHTILCPNNGWTFSNLLKIQKLRPEGQRSGPLACEACPA